MKTCEERELQRRRFGGGSRQSPQQQQTEDSHEWSKEDSGGSRNRYRKPHLRQRRFWPSPDPCQRKWRLSFSQFWRPPCRNTTTLSTLPFLKKKQSFLRVLLVVECWKEFLLSSVFMVIEMDLSAAFQFVCVCVWEREKRETETVSSDFGQERRDGREMSKGVCVFELEILLMAMGFN